MRAREGNGSISSLDSALTGTSGSNEVSRSPLGGEDLMGVEYPTRTSPGAGQPGTQEYYGPNGIGMLPLSDGRFISSRAQASELVEAHKKAIQSSHEQRARARKMTNTSSTRGHTSPLSDSPYVEAAVAADGDANNGSSPNQDTEDGNTSLEEEDITSLREKLAALGETVQIERKLAKREQQARRWNRESAQEDEIAATYMGESERIGTGFGPASSMGASVLARNEMLEEYLRTGEPSESEKVKRVATPKRDVFGRPVSECAFFDFLEGLD